MLGKDKSTALPAFHSYTGCDTVSSFFGKGKFYTWAAWKCYPEVTEAFKFIAENPFAKIEVGSKHFQSLERYTIVLYDKTSQLTSVNEARRQLFCQRDRGLMEALPPTQAALEQHVKRAIYQGSIWATADQPLMQAPSPEGMGWALDSDKQGWVPLWTTLPMASEVCSHLIKCSCKNAKGCGSSCRCITRGLRCSKRRKCNCKKHP